MRQRQSEPGGLQQGDEAAGGTPGADQGSGEERGGEVRKREERDTGGGGRVDDGVLADSGADGLQGRLPGGPDQERGDQHGPAGHNGPTDGFWSNVVWLPCRDGKARAVESGFKPVADGPAGDLGLVRLGGHPGGPREEAIIYAPLIQNARARVMRLRGYGNALVAPVAEEFIKAYMESQQWKSK